jgi:integrase
VYGLPFRHYNVCRLYPIVRIDGKNGFRSTLATWAEEGTDYPDGVREAARAHKYRSETQAAYQHGQKLEKRRALMKDWAQFLAGSNVICFRGLD